MRSRKAFAPQPPTGLRRTAARRRGENACRRTGFTLIELLVAGMILGFVWGAVSISLSQVSQAKRNSKKHLEAYLRADAALNVLRRDIASVLRSEDLFWTRLLLVDGGESSALGYLDRDEILLHNAQLRPIHDLDFIGEGMEYETQYRIETDALGPVLWRRRDAVPDEYSLGGGVATPLVEGVVALAVEAYDGDLWYSEWDSDMDGLPWAVRATVVASGFGPGDDIHTAPLAILRTVIPIDRPPLPFDELEEAEEPAEDEGLEGQDAGTGEAGAAGSAGGVSGGAAGRGGASGRTRTGEGDRDAGRGSQRRRRGADDGSIGGSRRPGNASGTGSQSGSTGSGRPRAGRSGSRQ
ncbi:MAG: hypothetical protein ACYS0G_08665 [Planctomycetota bacterium]|jgi:hypothetical protein